MMRLTRILLAATSLLLLLAVVAPPAAVAQELPQPITRPCTHPCLNKITFENAPHLDKLELHARINPLSAIDPASESFTVEIANANGTVFTATLNPGDLKATNGGKRFIYRNAAARGAGGLFRVQIAQRHDGLQGYRVDVLAYGDLSSATLADMSTFIVVGNAGFFDSSTWTPRVHGWSIDFPP
jgi:hypothetical protein